jgi:hypothetical protein
VIGRSLMVFVIVAEKYSAACGGVLPPAAGIAPPAPNATIIAATSSAFTTGWDAKGTAADVWAGKAACLRRL